MTGQLRSAALDRAQQGDSVVPVWWTDAEGRCACPRGADCRSPGKHPLTANGLDDAVSDASTVERWWARWPRANIAVRTDRVARIDIDLVEVAGTLADDLGLPHLTEFVRTPRGGLHLSVLTETPVDSSTLVLADGRRLGDLKARRAYVLVPPSAIGGRNYRRLSPEGVQPVGATDPKLWFGRLLEPFGLSLATVDERRRDYEVLSGTVHEGEGRHNALVSYAARIWVEGMAPDAFVGALRAVNEAQCDPPLPDDELVAIARHFVERREPSGQGPPKRSPVEEGADSQFARTDAGNGELFAHLYGDRVRYDHRQNRWLIWAGHWWQCDACETVIQLAVDAARWRYRNAEAITDLREREAEAAWAIGSENRRRIEAMLAMARTEPPIAGDGQGWDANPWLLGVANGVVDLRTGGLRDGRREDKITKHTPTPYQPEATCPAFKAFLDRVQPDEAMRTYLQRWAGYALTGHTFEQDLLLHHGSGANGKTTFANALMDALGPDYAKQAAPGLLLKSYNDRHPTEVADLDGARLVVSTEVGDGRALAEELVKQLTGGDRLKARRMRQDFFEFEATFKIMLLANHKPNIKGTDWGIWRRIKLVPWDVTIPNDERDALLRERLRAEAAGILAWAVRGCLDWQRNGMQEPESVAASTEAYRSENDLIGLFVEDRCVLGDHWTPAEAMYKAYKLWAVEQGLSERAVLSATSFGREIGQRFERVRQGKGRKRGYAGVGLLSERQEPFEADAFGTGRTRFESGPSENGVSAPDEPSREVNEKNASKASAPGRPCYVCGTEVPDADLCEECEMEAIS